MIACGFQPSSSKKWWWPISQSLYLRGLTVGKRSLSGRVSMSCFRSTLLTVDPQCSRKSSQASSFLSSSPPRCIDYPSLVERRPVKITFANGHFSSTSPIKDRSVSESTLSKKKKKSSSAALRQDRRRKNLTSLLISPSTSYFSQPDESLTILAFTFLKNSLLSSTPLASTKTQSPNDRSLTQRMVQRAKALLPTPDGPVISIRRVVEDFEKKLSISFCF